MAKKKEYVVSVPIMGSYTVSVMAATEKAAIKEASRLAKLESPKKTLHIHKGSGNDVGVHFNTTIVDELGDIHTTGDFDTYIEFNSKRVEVILAEDLMRMSGDLD